ncbi:unannotated protein [freshwater metagenome]|uniref:Unannotated protein n=1 Tax=freshwater metagenome TaxID=449393 RepID=A0A6J7S3P4_9ZZZZ
MPLIVAFGTFSETVFEPSLVRTALPVLEIASSEPPLAAAPLILISTLTDAAAKALPALSAKSASSEVK